MTNNELTSLRDILASDTDPLMACVHYEALLLDLLQNANRRFTALDLEELAARETRIAEIFDAIVRTDNGCWRVSGHTIVSQDVQSTWQEHRDPVYAE
jgi:hypothetical protein